jgi:glycosyltransferase involved in cell wall biosynthesis
LTAPGVARLRIALTADPELPVPPLHYGGIERIVDMLARGLTARGHEVTVFAHADSVTAGQLVPWPGKASRSKADTVKNAAVLARHVLSGRFDLVHSFSRVAYLLPILPLRIRRSVRLGHELSRGVLWFSAISRQMTRGAGDIGTWRLVYNGVPLSAYDFRPDPGADAPLVFLGRIEEIKGPHLAIEVARRSGQKLLIAGNVPAEHLRWFDAMIAPHLCDERISYVGPLDDVQKNALLGGAKALLMPIVWEEPFGIVMAEAMACGTPVLGLARGAVPEVVQDGVTGFLAEDVDGLVLAVHRLGEIDRAACRARAEQLFSDSAVVDGYLDVYGQMLGKRRGSPVPASVRS